MSFEIVGKLHKVFPTENKSASFQAREFVIETTEGNYPNFIKFQLTQDRCALIDGYKVEEPIKVHFDLRGREWQDKYFTNLNAWRLEAVTTSSSDGNDTPVFSNDPFPTADEEPFGDDGGLPF